MPSSAPSTLESQLRRARTELEDGLRSGNDVHAEDLIAAYPELALEPDAALELIYSEFVVREDMGQRPTPDEWYDRFPLWRSDLEQMFQVHDELREAEASLPPWSPRHARKSGLRLPSGEMIGDYEVLGELGRGGMGVVYKARQTRLNRTVALKLILSGEHAGTKERDRFQREVEAAARLDHRNIVRIFEVGEHQGRPFCSMEFVDGGSLADELTGTPWPARPAAELAALLARAAHHAHERGVVHRDLKPANILLVGTATGPELGPPPVAVRRFDREPKIADFGLAKCLTDDGSGPTRTGDFLGTPTYMAPEQADGRSRLVGAVTDVWALGVVLYEMLTGRPPFQGDSSAETMQQVRHDDPVSLRRLRPGLPRDLETIGLKCLRKDPSERYSTAAALADDLERWLRGEPIRARPLGPVGRFVRWCRRSPRVAWLSGAVAALCLAAVGLGIAAVVNLADARDQAGKMADQERRARRAEADSRIRDRGRVARLQLIDATRRLEEGDPSGAAVIFAAALRNDPDPDAAPVHRTRLATALRASPRLTRAFWTHTARPQIVMASEDGSTIFTSTPDEGMRVWNPATGQSLPFTGQPGRDFRAPVLSHNGRVVLFQDFKGHAAARDLRTGLPVDLPLNPDLGRVGWPFSRDGARWVSSTLAVDNPLVGSAGGAVRAMPIDPSARPGSNAVSPDGRLFVQGYDDGSVQIFDATTRAPVRRLDLGPLASCSALTFSPDGTRIAAGSVKGTAQIWELATGRAVGFRIVHGDQVWKIDYSPDGRRILTSGSDLTVRVWDAVTGLPIGKPMQMDYHRGTGFSPDGRAVVSISSDDSSRVWEVATGRPLTPPLMHGGGQARFLRDGRHLLTLGLDGAVRHWELPAPVDLRDVSPIQHLAWLHDGRTLLTVGSNNRLWDGLDGTSLHKIPQRGSYVGDVSPDGTRVLTVGNPDSGPFRGEHLEWEVRQWDTRTGEPVGARFIPGCDRLGPPPVYAPDGRIVTTTSDARIRFWDAETGRPSGPEWKQPRHYLWGVRFSPDGRRMFSHGMPSVLWNVADGRPIRTFDEQTKPDSIDFSPDGTFVARLESAGLLRFYDAGSGELLPGSIEVGDSAKHLTVSPDGRRIMAYRIEDHSFRVWDRRTGQPVGPPLRHPREPYTFAFSPNGLLLAQSSLDGLTTVWDIASGIPVVPSILIHEGIVKLAFSPASDRLAVGGPGGQVRIVDLTPDPRPLEEIEAEAQLVSDRRIDDRGDLIPLTRAESVALWRRFHPE